MLADRGYFSGPQVLACEEAGIIPICAKPLTSGAKTEGRWGKQDFVYQPDSDTYRRPAGETMQARLDRIPGAMPDRRRTVEHVFGTIKDWMGRSHFKTRTLKNVATEMSLNILAYNIKRTIALVGVSGLIAAIQA